LHKFCRPFGAFFRGREKSSTRVLKTEGTKGNSSTLFFLGWGSGLGPTLHPTPILTLTAEVEVEVQKVAQQAKRENFILWSTDSSNLLKKRVAL
jgi:hypothetical protein